MVALRGSRRIGKMDTYGDDGKEKGWFTQGEVQIKAKGPGLSIMVSEFQCPCHGTMLYGDEVARTLFYAGM